MRTITGGASNLLRVHDDPAGVDAPIGEAGEVALLLAWALIFNLTMLPYATWFKAAMLGAFRIACLLGIKYGRRVPSSAAVTDAALRR